MARAVAEDEDDEVLRPTPIGSADVVLTTPE
jgi:hypothetical protein